MEPARRVTSRVFSQREFEVVGGGVTHLRHLRTRFVKRVDGYVVRAGLELVGGPPAEQSSGQSPHRRTRNNVEAYLSPRE